MINLVASIEVACMCSAAIVPSTIRSPSMKEAGASQVSVEPDRLYVP